MLLSGAMPDRKESPRGPLAASDRRRLGAALALVALAAAAARLWRVGAGLPDFLEEAAPFRTALAMWNLPAGPTSWNPHSFVYPSLAIYLHLLLQKLGFWLAGLAGAVRSPADWHLLTLLDPAVVVLPARVLHVACGVANVVLAGLVAERLRRGAGVPAALLAAFAPTPLVASRLIYVDTPMTTFALAALERMLAWHERGGRARLWAAVACAGLAAGTKYPGAVALLPLAWLLWERRGARGLALWAAAAAGAAAVFALTTPYALLDAAALAHDLGLHVLHLAGGHLGQSAAGAQRASLLRLLGDLGPAGLVLLVLAAARAARRPRARAATVAALLFALAFLVPILAARYTLGYYLVPVVPVAAAVAAAEAVGLLERFAPGRRVVAWAALALLLAPVLVGGLRAAASGGTRTEVEARRWLEAQVGASEIALVEPWGPRLPSLRQRLEAQASLDAARPELRQRFEARGWLHAVELPLTVAGRAAARVTSAAGERHEVDVFPSALELNRIAYDPRLFALADWVVTSGAVRGRFEADPARFPAECRLYRLLDATATVAARFEPRGGDGGPVVTVHRLGPLAHAALAASGGLPSLWWTESVPQGFRRAVTSLLDRPWDDGVALRADGTAAPWVRSLAPLYDDALRPFADDLATNLVDLGRCDAAQPLVEGTLLVLPRDPVARRLYEACSSQAPPPPGP
jgi:4-amino-4-deoxy-L-arabinose transferase-like glycosyltransferase